MVAVIDLEPPAHWVLEYYPVEVMSTDGDTRRIRFRASEANVVASLLLRLGPDARLIEGEEVRDALTDRKAKVLARYQ